MCNFSKVSSWLIIKVSNDRPICCYYKLIIIVMYDCIWHLKYQMMNKKYLS